MADLSKVVHFTNVRLSYPNIITPQVSKDAVTGKERISYGASLIFLPNHPDFARFMQVANQVAVGKWGDKAALVMNHIQSDKSKRCYAMGEEKINTTTMLPNPENIGHIIISSYNPKAPQMVDALGTPVDPENTMAYQAIARKLYAGCRVNVVLKPWPQDNAQGKAIRCELVAIQFHGDDTPFGEGHVDVTGMFGATEAPAAPGFAAAAWSQPGAAPPAFVTPNPFAQPTFGAPAAAHNAPGFAPPVWAVPSTTPPSFLR